MKTYNLHIIQSDEEIHIGFTSSAPNFVRAYSAFSAVCHHMVSGFGDAKSSKLYRLIEEVEKTGKGSMSYKYQGNTIEIKVDTQ